MAHSPLARGASWSASASGLWLVQQFQLVNLLKQPIAPYLTGAGGKLIVTSPTEPVMIVFKLGFIVGLVLASPIILWQLWAFLAPALYAREKRALVPGAVRGAAAVPDRRPRWPTSSSCRRRCGCCSASRPRRSSRSSPTTTTSGSSLQVVLALGLSFELPLVIIILAWLDVIGPARAGPLPPLRGRGGLRGRRDPVAGHRPGLDDHDDDPAAAALRGGRTRAPS